MCSSLENIISPTLSILFLTIILCVGLMPLELVSVHFRMSIVILFQLIFRQLCWRDLTGVVLTFLGKRISQQTH